MEHAATDSRTFDEPVALRPVRLLVVFCLIVACALLCVWARHQVTETGYALDETRRELKDARAENRQLLLDLSRLKSPDHLEACAGHFGLAEMSIEQVRRIEVDDVAR